MAKQITLDNDLIAGLEAKEEREDLDKLIDAKEPRGAFGASADDGFDNVAVPEDEFMDAPPSPEPILPPPEDPATRRQKMILKTKIRSHLAASYGEELLKLGVGENLDGLSVDELGAVLEDINFALDANDNKFLFEEVYHGALVPTITSFGVGRGYKIDKLPLALRANKKVDRLLERLSIDWSDRTAMSPEKRLTLITLQTAFQLHLIVSQAEKQAEVMKSNLSKEVDPALAQGPVFSE